jgi:outer membrane protein
MRRRVATVPDGASAPQLPAGPVPEPRARSRSVLLALGLFAVTCVVAAASPWTARDAVATALRQSPDAEAARHRLEASEAMRQQAESAWKPQLTITGGYIQTNNALTALSFTLNQRNFGFDLNFNRPGWVDDLNVVGTLGYNLYSGGQATARRSAAHAGSRAAGHDLRAVS